MTDATKEKETKSIEFRCDDEIDCAMKCDEFFDEIKTMNKLTKEDITETTISSLSHPWIRITSRPHFVKNVNCSCEFTFVKKSTLQKVEQKQS